MKGYQYLNIVTRDIDRSEKSGDWLISKVATSKGASREDIQNMVREHGTVIELDTKDPIAEITITSTTTVFLEALNKSIANSLSEEIRETVPFRYGLTYIVGKKLLQIVWMGLLDTFGRNGWEPFGVAMDGSLHFRREYERNT